MIMAIIILIDMPQSSKSAKILSNAVKLQVLPGGGGSPADI